MLNENCVGVAFWVEMSLFASYRLCRCSFVTEIYCLLVMGCVVCCVVTGMLLLESFGLWWCNALTSVRYHYSNLTFEVEEVWSSDNTRTSG